MRKSSSSSRLRLQLKQIVWPIVITPFRISNIGIGLRAVNTKERPRLIEGTIRGREGEAQGT